MCMMCLGESIRPPDHAPQNTHQPNPTTKQDEEMLNKFRASLEEAEVIKDRNLALDFIGKRGSIENAGRVRLRICVQGLVRIGRLSVGSGLVCRAPQDSPALSLTHTCIHVYI